MIVGIGIDIVELDRVQKALERHSGRFASKLFTDVEREYSDRFKIPVQHYAVRFAAKEAFVKALGTGFSGGIGWKEIGVVNEPSGQPRIEVTGRAWEKLEQLGATEIHVSLSHSRDHASAVVILEKLE